MTFYQNTLDIAFLALLFGAIPLFCGVLITVVWKEPQSIRAVLLCLGGILVGTGGIYFLMRSLEWYKSAETVLQTAIDNGSTVPLAELASPSAIVFGTYWWCLALAAVALLIAPMIHAARNSNKRPRKNVWDIHKSKKRGVSFALNGFDAPLVWEPSILPATKRIRAA